MDIRNISSRNFIPIIDPEFIHQSPDEFLAENGGFLSEVAIVAKSTSGYVHFRSATAPGRKESNDFFSTFASIADSIGIKVYAWINCYADQFFAKNPSYSAIKDGGNTSSYFVDPFRTSYTTYLKSILQETLIYPIQGVILDNIRFPREDYSFCEPCSRAFAEQYGIERMFSLNDIQKNSRLYQEWLKWRRNKIEEIIKELINTVTSKPNLVTNCTIDIDPTLQAEKGAIRHFGQDINSISKFCTPTIHLSAWTPYPTSNSAPEFQKLLSSLKFAKEFQTQTQKPLNLHLWGIENEAILNFLETLKSEFVFRKVYIQNHYPSDYQKRREIHLGLS